MTPQKRSNAARLFGYDVFISFALGPPPRGTQSYASDLARRLRERDLTVFFSEDEMPPGEYLDASLRVALRRAKTLVIVANRAMLEAPRWVRKEVEEFRARHPSRPIVCISIDGALQDAALGDRVAEWLSFHDKVWLEETADAVASGIASEGVVNRLVTAPMKIRSNVSWRWVVRAVVAGLATLAIALAVATKMANDSADRARAELRRAVALRLASEAAAMLAGRRLEGDERALLEIVAAKRLDSSAAIDGALLDALLARQQMIKLIPANGSVSSVTFSPDGRWIASGESPPAGTKSTAYPIRLLDAASGKPIGTTFAGHTFGISALLFNADASRLFSASFDETMRLWNTMTGQIIGSPRDAGARGVNAIAVNPSGTLMVSAHADETIRFWNPENLEPIGLPREGHRLEAVSLAFSPDGTRFASGSWGPSLRIWDAATFDPIVSSEENGQVRSLAFSPDGTKIVTGGVPSSSADEGEVRLWDALSAKAVGESLPRLAAAVNSVAWSRDGKLIAFAGYDKAIHLWDPTIGQPKGTPLLGHSGGINSIAFSNQSDRLVSAGDDNTLRVWSVADEALGRRVLDPSSSSAMCVVFTRDGSRIITGHRDGKLRFWNTETGKLVTTTNGVDSAGVFALALSPDGSRLAASHESQIRFWDVSSGLPVGKPLEGHLGRITTLAWSATGDRLASAGYAFQHRQSTDHAVRLWDPAAGRLIATLGGDDGPVSGLAFTPDGKQLLSNSGSLQLWNSADGSLIRTTTLQGSGILLTNGDGSRLFSTEGGRLHMRNGMTLDALPTPLDYHSEGITGVVLNHDATRLISASSDGTMRLWDAGTGDLIGNAIAADKDMTSIAISPDGTMLASTAENGTIRLWPAFDAWVSAICSKLTRNMTVEEWRKWVSPELEYVVQCPGLSAPPP